MNPVDYGMSLVWCLVGAYLYILLAVAPHSEVPRHTTGVRIDSSSIKHVTSISPASCGVHVILYM